MSSRRKFFSRLAGAAGMMSLSGISSGARALDVSGALVELRQEPLKDAVNNDELWRRIQQAYTVNPNIINLNNGGVSPQPKVVQDAVDRFYHLSNEGPSYYMWRTLDRGRETVRRKLSEVADAPADTLAVNRNATEALDTVIFGLPLAQGDEVVLTKQDYPNMINAWKQRAARDGIVLKWLNLDMPEEDPDVIIRAFEGATTRRTKVWHITHMINWNGQILPAKELCTRAREREVLSLVDGAHTFAHLDFSISEMGCDFFGTSLHKWLCAPFGTGMMYMKSEHIAEVWPLIPHHEPRSSDIRKFEALGTRSFAPEQAIGHAVNFHQAIGSEVKQQRLHYLKNYWAEKVQDHPKINIGTSLDPAHSCALAIVDVDGMDPGDVSTRLMNEYRIHTTAINWENIRGVRITPHVYTLTSDLDVLVEGLLRIADG